MFKERVYILNESINAYSYFLYMKIIPKNIAEAMYLLNCQISLKMKANILPYI